MPNYFPAVMAHGRGIMFGQPLVGGLRPCVADHECLLLPAHSSAGVLGSQSINAEAKFLSDELLKGIFPSSGERRGRGKRLDL